jgi:hypothetical protein
MGEPNPRDLRCSVCGAAHPANGLPSLKKEGGNTPSTRAAYAIPSELVTRFGLILANAEHKMPETINIPLYAYVFPLFIPSCKG